MFQLKPFKIMRSGGGMSMFVEQRCLSNAGARRTLRRLGKFQWWYLFKVIHNRTMTLYFSSLKNSRPMLQLSLRSEHRAN